ncbi:unnamed protein product [Zymoseptoria tritici ST99CH_3D1]|nr:unnamed protein product [Zymoseptoria tritici ST99CH_3D1]
MRLPATSTSATLIAATLAAPIEPLPLAARADQDSKRQDPSLKFPGPFPALTSLRLPPTMLFRSVPSPARLHGLRMAIASTTASHPLLLAHLS